MAKPSSSTSDPPASKGLKALLTTWVVTAGGALSTLFIEPTGEGFQRGLNRAIPFLVLLGLSVVVALLLGVKTLHRRRHLRKRTQCLCLLPLLAVIAAALMLLDYLVNNRWALDGLGNPPAAPEAVDEMPAE